MPLRSTSFLKDNPLGKTIVDSYIAASYRRLMGNSRVRYVSYIYLEKPLPYLVLRYFLFLKNLSILVIYSIILLIRLSIYILPYI